MRNRLLFLCGLATIACAPATDSHRVTAEVLEAFKRFEGHLNKAEYEAALAFYADDPRFSAYEDGETRYRSYADLAAGYERLPSYGKGEFRYDNVEVLVLDDDHARIATSFWTAFGEQGQPGYFQFHGKLTILLERFEEGWKMLSLHSSTPKTIVEEGR